MILRRLSVRWLLVIVMVAFTGIILLVQGIPLSSYLRSVERDRIVTGLERDAFTLAGASEEALQLGGQIQDDGVQTAIRRYASTSGARVVVVGADGRVTASSDGTDLRQEYTNRPEIEEALAGRPVAGERDSRSVGEPLLYVAVPVRSGTNVLGAVRITYPAAEVDAVVDDKVRLLSIVGIVTLLAAAGIAFLLASIVTRPLRRLSDTAEAIADGDLSARVDPHTIGELGDVADAFNRMAKRVEALVAAQRGFAGDASHQLRTPLTALRLRLEMAEAMIGANAELAESLEAMRDDVDRMQRLVDGLLVLARADRDEQRLSPVDVGAIVLERVESWRPLAAEHEVSIHVVGQGRLETPNAWAMPDALDQIIDNYVDNAVEVAPQGSVITLEIIPSHGHVDIVVEDQGPGLLAEAKAHAFDRFWRGDSQRPGSGLGLAIVRSLADASGAVVRLDDAQGSPTGVRAVVSLRSAPAGSSPPSANTSPSAAID